MNGGRNPKRLRPPPYIYEHHYETIDYFLLKIKSSPWLQ